MSANDNSDNPLPMGCTNCGSFSHVRNQCPLPSPAKQRNALTPAAQTPPHAALSATQPAQAAQSDAASEAFSAMAAGVPVDAGWVKAQAAQGEPVQGVPERAEMALRMLEDPTPEMLESFQRGFMQQLKRRKHYKKGWEISAEQAGIRTMLETVLASIDAASTPLPAHKSPNPLDWADCLRISETPEVDEALRLFSDGETSEDQAVCIVQAVLRAAQQGE